MEYNSQRDTIKISDYGRNVYKLIQYAKTIKNREERTQMAESIIGVMAMVNPQVRDAGDFRRKLWNHLMIMADWELDVDTPYEVVRPEEVNQKPLQLAYSSNNTKYRHYGKTMERMLEKVSEMPEGEERTMLTEQLANTMKRLYLTWNSDTVEDALILEQMKVLSNGRLQPGEDFELEKDFVIEKAECVVKSGKKKHKKK